MRTVPTGLLMMLTVLSQGCGTNEAGLPLDDVRSQLTSPKPLRYLTQTIGAGHTGDATPDGGRTLWYPLAAPDAGRRLVLEFGPDQYLARAVVVAAGPGGRYDVTEQVLFDRRSWQDRTRLP